MTGESEDEDLVPWSGDFSVTSESSILLFWDIDRTKKNRLAPTTCKSIDDH